MVKVYDRDGLIVRTSKNLRGIMTHCKCATLKEACAEKPFSYTLFKNGVLVVRWTNGDHCRVKFESYNVLCIWLHSRRSWVGKRIIDDGEPF